MCDFGKQFAAAMLAGDQEVVQSLLDWIGPKLQAHFRDRGATREDAEDICQEVLITLSQYPQMNVWILARQAASRFYRAANARKRMPEGGIQGESQFDANDTERPTTAGDLFVDSSSIGQPVADRVLRRELRRAIRAAIVRMTEPYRTVLWLRMFGTNRSRQLDFGEIGERTGLPKEKIYQLWHRGLVQLRRILIDELGYD